MSRETHKIVDGVVQYDYHLSADHPITGFAKSYAHVDPQPWFDMHVALEIGILMRGRVERYWETMQATLSPGDVWLSGVFERNGYRVVRQPCDVVVMFVWPDSLSHTVLPELPDQNWLSLFTRAAHARPQTTTAQRATVLDIGRRLQRLGVDDGQVANARRRLLLLELLLLFMDASPASGRDRHTAADGYERIAPAIDLALRSRTFVSQDAGASACGMNRHNFRRAFESLLGVSFTRFALRHRLQGAAVDMTHSDSPMKAIASSWGFTDQSHLHHVFKREYGCAPRAYRDQHRHR